MNFSMQKVEDVRFKTNKHKTKGSKQTDYDMSDQTIELFRKYLLTKSQNYIVGKTNKEESDAIKNKSPPRALIPLLPSKFDCNFSRPPSLLERKLLPGIRGDEMQTSLSTGDKTSKAQLTIFYAGVINVYDDIPTDKAQAIMLLAGQKSFSRPIANENPKAEAKTPLRRPNIESSCKLQADLPIARKISLQHFLEKRRRRIVNNAPYARASAAASNSANRDDQEKDNELNISNHRSISSLSPFPSRLGYFLPVPTNRGCQA